MKTYVTSLAVIIALSSSFSALAGAGMTDNQLVTQCRTSVKESIGNVDRIKLVKLKSRRGLFEVKFRVVANGERSVVSCEANREKVVAISCLTGNACNSSNLTVTTQ